MVTPYAIRVTPLVITPYATRVTPLVVTPYATQVTPLEVTPIKMWKFGVSRNDKQETHKVKEKINLL